MKTALRTYHPVPSLQKTDGNLQDAPRIKNCLKSALLPDEMRDGPPTSLAEVLERLVSNIYSLVLSGAPNALVEAFPKAPDEYC